MNKTLCFLLAMLMTLGFASCRKKEKVEEQPISSASASLASEASEPDPTTPEGAVVLLVSDVKTWDSEKASTFISQATGRDALPEAYGEVVAPILQRLDISVGNSRITGDTAIVDASVTAVDAQRALSDVLVQAMGYVALQQAGGNTKDSETLLAEYIVDNVDFSKLSTIKTDCTIHLVEGADGEWKLDMNDPKNLGFLNAASGGMVDLAETMRGLMPQPKA